MNGGSGSITTLSLDINYKIYTIAIWLNRPKNNGNNDKIHPLSPLPPHTAPCVLIRLNTIFPSTASCCSSSSPYSTLLSFVRSSVFNPICKIHPLRALLPLSYTHTLPHPTKFQRLLLMHTLCL